MALHPSRPHPGVHARAALALLLRTGRRGRRLLCAGLLAALLTAGLGSGNALDAYPMPSQPANPHGTVTLPLAGSSDLGPVSPGTPLSLILVLHDPTTAQQTADLAALYSPRSPRFGHYLSPQTVAARYGPSPSTVAGVRSALQRLGLSARWTRGYDWMVVSGEARRMESAFGVHTRWYRSPRGTRYYASDRGPSVPSALRPYIAEVGPLSNYFEPIPQAAIPDGGLSPVDLLGVYDMAPLRNLGLDGTGQTVAFLEFDGYTQRSLDTFTAKYNLPAIHPQNKNPVPKAFLSETEMDLEVVHEIAPGAKLVVYYLDWSAMQKMSAADALTAVLDLQTRMVNENPRAVISQSWGMCENPLGKAQALAYKNLYDHADALGETVFTITHDDAAYNCLAGAPRGTAPSPEYLGIPLPGDAPGVTAVGGTRVSMSTNGGWYNETVWVNPAETIGTGGGVSVFYPRPAWQQGPGVQDLQRNPRNMRSVPDVSADGDPVSGAAICITDQHGASTWSLGGGTSQSAPIWAGIGALINQYLKQKDLPTAGFMNPAFYQIAAHPYPYRAFHDITLGNNLYYPATPDYDMASGLGTPDVWNLARDIKEYVRGHAP
jgi:subtilase family serine protease